MGIIIFAGFALFVSMLSVSVVAGEESPVNFIDRLNQIESWAEMPRDTFPRSDTPLLQIVVELCYERPQVVREVIQALQEIAEANVAAGDAVNKWSIIFVINRAYCNVPVWEDVAQRRLFGGWIGIPERDNKFGLLYPLALQVDGTFTLEGPVGGYAGAAYQGLEEFNFLLQKYGRRQMEAPQ